MKKIIISILIVLTLALSVGSVFAVDETLVTTYAVRFYSNSEDFSQQTVPANTCASLPASPTKTGHTFKGWSLSKGDMAVINVLTYRVNADTNFYAVYEANKYTVIFEYADTTGLMTSRELQVTHNDFVTVPEIPQTVNGSTFLGWDNDITLPITDAVKFTAQYSLNHYVVTYYDIDGSIIGSEYKSGLEPINDYTAPTIEGKLFRTWKTVDGTKIKDTTRISADVDLYADYSVDVLKWFTDLEWWAQALIIGGIFVLLCLFVSIFRGKR